MTFRLTLVATMLVTLQLGGGGSVFAQSTPYDDFSAPVIRGDRWRTDQFEAGAGSGLDTLRLVSNGALLLAHRVVGGHMNDPGSTISAARMFFNSTPGGAGAVKFDLTVLGLTATGCSVAGSTFTDAEARFSMELFEVANGVVVTATVGVTRDSQTNQLRAMGGVTGLGTVDLGPVTIGTPNTFRMSWNPAGNRVDFQRNSNSVQPIVYSDDDSHPVPSPFVLMEAVGFVANCAVAPRPLGIISALFDNVFVNP